MTVPKNTYWVKAAPRGRVAHLREDQSLMVCGFLADEVVEAQPGTPVCRRCVERGQWLGHPSVAERPDRRRPQQ